MAQPTMLMMGEDPRPTIGLARMALNRLASRRYSPRDGNFDREPLPRTAVSAFGLESRAGLTLRNIQIVHHQAGSRSVA